MAKKKSAKKAAAAPKKSTTKKAAGKKTAGERGAAMCPTYDSAPKQAAGKKKAPPQKHSHAEPETVEIVLDATEGKAVQLAETSDEVCDELEKVVTEAVSKSVRDVYKKRGVALSLEQAQNVALTLFGD
jgi:hypothetical protein